VGLIDYNKLSTAGKTGEGDSCGTDANAMRSWDNLAIADKKGGTEGTERDAGAKKSRRRIRRRSKHKRGGKTSRGNF